LLGLNGAGIAYVAGNMLLFVLMIPPLLHEYRTRAAPANAG